MPDIRGNWDQESCPSSLSVTIILSVVVGYINESVWHSGKIVKAQASKIPSCFNMLTKAMPGSSAGININFVHLERQSE